MKIARFEAAGSILYGIVEGDTGGEPLLNTPRMDLGLLTLGDHRADPATGQRSTQGERHSQILDYLDFAAPAGFDTVIVGEHHFSDFITAAPPVFLAWLARIPVAGSARWSPRVSKPSSMGSMIGHTVRFVNR